MDHKSSTIFSVGDVIVELAGVSVLAYSFPDLLALWKTTHFPAQIKILAGGSSAAASSAARDAAAASSSAVRVAAAAAVSSSSKDGAVAATSNGASAAKLPHLQGEFCYSDCVLSLLF
jgi:hypothetical protein